MNWTIDVPTKPGWYWVVCDNCVQMVELDEYDFWNGPLFGFWTGDVVRYTAKDSKFWMGPIEPPEMPE